MVLLPLIDHAIVYGLEPSHSGGSIRIATSISQGKLRLTVLDSGAGFVEAGPGNDGIQAIRDRLDALYGREAQLVLKAEESHGTRAVMEIPCERSERPKAVATLGASEPAHSAIS
jgi:LytS/YehU family sensor histidine kinase